MIRIDKIIAAFGNNGMIPAGTAILLAYVLMWAVHKGDQVEAHDVVIKKYTATVDSIDKRLYRMEIINRAIAKEMDVKIPNDDAQ